MHHLLIVLALVSFTLPPAAKTLAVVVTVFGVLQAIKRNAWANQYLVSGWKAVAFNVIFTAFGTWAVLPANDLYDPAVITNTLLQALLSAMASAGIHGTVQALGTPTVVATTPPDTTLQNVPAHLEPNDPDAIAVEKK